MATFFVTSIDVNVPVRTAYNQWTRFEDFPRFIEGVKVVHQLDDGHLQWITEIGGQEKEWDAEIIEQTPDLRIAWRSQSSPIKGGVVSFQRLSDARSTVSLQITYDPEGLVEHIGDAFGMVSSHVRRNLKRFKALIEQRGQKTSGAGGGRSEEFAVPRFEKT